MRPWILLGVLLLSGCLEATGISASTADGPEIVYDETLSIADADDDRSVAVEVPAGFRSLTVFISGRNSAGSGTNVRLELFGPDGIGGGYCICGGGTASDGESSFGSGGRHDASGTWTLKLEAEGRTAIHLRVRANPTGGG